MTTASRFLAMGAISVALATSSIASAQTYTTIDFPGAVSTTLNGGPNPEGTNIGSYTDTGGITHGFMLKKGAFTSFDPPGSVGTTPNWISPQGVIVGSFIVASGASHGFILSGGTYTTLDFPGAAGTVLTATTFAQSAQEVRGRTPFIPIGKEPPAQLIVDPPNPQALAAVGVVLIQYRAENVHIVPAFGPAALSIFPRVGHLHVNVDDLPWHWADASDTGTIDIKDLPPGQHKVVIDLVDGNHQLFPGQSKTVTFTVPGTAPYSH